MDTADIARANSRLLEQLVELQEDFSDAEHGRVTSEHRGCELARMLDERVDELTALLEEKELENEVLKSLLRNTEYKVNGTMPEIL